jgi:hypothetical protein
MRIRSITLFADLAYPLDQEALRGHGAFLARARQEFTAAGYSVQSVRLASQPFVEVLGPGGAAAAPAFARELEALVRAHGVDYVSIGPAGGPAGVHDAAAIEVLHTVLAETEAVFGAVDIASQGGVHLAAVRQMAALIRAVATLSPDGFANLRLAALANCPPGSPFFPVAYAAGGGSSFAVATEAADLALAAFEGAGGLAAGWAALVAAVEGEAALVEGIAAGLMDQGVAFGGIDFSLAPYPEEQRSLGAAIERLGVARVGAQGSLFSAALLADALDHARFTRCGFSGLMLPVLEDAVLAERAAEGLLTVTDLLLYSAVCGAGLDTIPLPGDIGEDELAAILLDVAALSTRLSKPLTARLMPIPGLRAGDPVAFPDFPYFAPSRVMAAKASLGRPPLLLGGETLTLRRLRGLA